MTDDTRHNTLNEPAAKLTQRLSIQSIRAHETPSIWSRLLLPSLSTVFKGLISGALLVGVSGCFLAVFIPKDVQYYEGAKIIYPPPAYPPIFDHLWIILVSVVALSLFISQARTFIARWKQARIDRADGDIIYQCLTRVLPYASATRHAKYTLRPTKQQLDVTLRNAERLTIHIHEEDDEHFKVKTSVTASNFNPSALTHLKNIGQHNPTPPIVRRESGNIHIEGLVPKPPLDERLRCADGKAKPNDVDAAAEIAGWVQELLRITQHNTDPTAQQLETVLLKPSNVRPDTVQVDAHQRAELRTGSIAAGPQAALWLKAKMSTAGALFSILAIGAAITTAIVWGVFGGIFGGATSIIIGSLFGCVLAFAFGHVSVVGDSTPLRPRQKTKEQLTSQNGKLTLNQHTITLDQPFQVQLTQSSDRDTLGVELVQTNNTTEPEKLRFQVPIVTGSVQNLPIYNMAVPMVEASAFRNWIWPTIRHAAASHGNDPKWDVLDAEATVQHHMTEPELSAH